MAAVGMMHWISAAYGSLANPATNVKGFLGLEETGRGSVFQGYGGDADVGITTASIGRWEVDGAIVLTDFTTALTIADASGIQGFKCLYKDSAGATKTRKYVGGVIFGTPAQISYGNSDSGGKIAAFRIPFKMVFGATQTLAGAITYL